LQLDRDLDVVLVGREDVARPLTLPAGRLREPFDTLVVADAIVVEEGVVIETAGLPAPVFTMKRHLGASIFSDASPTASAGPEPVKPFVFAGVAQPGEFFQLLRSSGVTMAGTRAFSDHHRYCDRDLQELVSAARSAGANALVTTEKDYVRLLPFRPFPLRLGFVPLTIQAEPHAEFAAWLTAGLGAARDSAGD
jgi:tetraacyldisaccharide 4'-kinase